MDRKKEIVLLAIDPSTVNLGWALYKNSKPMAEGCWQPGKIDSPLDLLSRLQDFLDDVYNEKIDVVAIEKPFMRNRNNSAISLTMLRQVKAWCKACDSDYVEYGNLTVKRVVAGHGDADKEEVYFAVKHLMLTRKTKENIKYFHDISDAHAVAQTAIICDFQPLDRK